MAYYILCYLAFTMIKCQNFYVMSRHLAVRKCIYSFRQFDTNSRQDLIIMLLLSNQLFKRLMVKQIFFKIIIKPFLLNVN